MNGMNFIVALLCQLGKPVPSWQSGCGDLVMLELEMHYVLTMI